jgi:hypothetical protein
MGDLDDTRQDLAGAFSALRDVWLEARAGWKDDQGARFEGGVWREVEDGVPRALRAVEELGDLLERIRSDED